MKQKLIFIIALLAILPVFSYSADKEITCIIKGKVIGRNSHEIMLIKTTEDFALGKSKSL